MLDILKMRSLHSRLALVAAAISVAAILSVSVHKTRASVDSGFDPSKHVQLNSGGIVVTWVSPEDEDGVVEWALSAGDLASRSGSFATAQDSRGPLTGRLNKRTHRVAASNIRGGSTIHYNIVSGGETHPGGPYQVTIPSGVLMNPPVGLTGKVRYADGSPGRECLVYMQITQVVSGVAQQSLWNNTITNGGGFTAEIRNIRSRQNFDTPLVFDADSGDATISVNARCGPGLEGGLTRTTADADKLKVLGSVAEYQKMEVVVSGTAAAPPAQAGSATASPMPATSGGGCSIGRSASSPATGAAPFLLMLPAGLLAWRRRAPRGDGKSQ